jgi:hypothetical protein
VTQGLPANQEVSPVPPAILDPHLRLVRHLFRPANQVSSVLEAPVDPRLNLDRPLVIQNLHPMLEVNLDLPLVIQHPHPVLEVNLDH